MKRKILCLTMLCLLAVTICGCQSQENGENVSSYAGETGAETEIGNETGTENAIWMLEMDDESKKYVDYFLDLYSLCEYNAPEDVSRLSIVMVTRKGDQILEEEPVAGVDFTERENMRSAVIAIYQAVRQEYNIRVTSADGKSVQADSVEFTFTEGDTIGYQGNNLYFDQRIVSGKQYPLFSATRSPENAPADGSETEDIEICAVFH